MEQKPPHQPDNSKQHTKGAGETGSPQSMVSSGDGPLSSSHHLLETIEHELHEDLTELEEVVKRVRR